MTNRRARQAEATHADILGAARALFSERGYSATSVKDIAVKAEVSVQTVYDSVGSKAELVRQLNDYVGAEAGVAEIASAIPTETDPQKLLAIPVRIAGAFVERCGDILRATASGSAAEPELRIIATVGHQRHNEGVERLTARLDDLGALRPGLSVGEAASTISVITTPWFTLMLVDEYAWTIERYEAWAVDVLARSVLKPRRAKR
jgi:AcrR family transcriptional regulator